MTWITSSSPPRITASSNAQRNVSIDPASSKAATTRRPAILGSSKEHGMTAVGRLV